LIAIVFVVLLDLDHGVTLSEHKDWSCALVGREYFLSLLFHLVEVRELGGTAEFAQH
jgi:hypothetical protein